MLPGVVQRVKREHLRGLARSMGGGKDVLDEKGTGGDVYFFGAILQKKFYQRPVPDCLYVLFDLTTSSKNAIIQCLE